MTTNLRPAADGPTTVISGLPACPGWCPGGHKANDGDDQVHEKVIASFVAVDSDSDDAAPRPVEVELFIERYDTLKDAHLVSEPIRTRAIVEFVHEIDGKRRIIRASMTETQLRALAVGAFWASNLLDTTDDQLAQEMTAGLDTIRIEGQR